MMVFLVDARYTTRIGKVRTEIFGKDRSAKISRSHRSFRQRQRPTRARIVTGVP
jgi:hypothetical protein